MNEEELNKDGQGSKDDENLSADKAENEGSFGTPENYFESFSARLFSKIKAEDELKDYPLLSAAGKNNPFAVPADYFELREELLEYILLRDLRLNHFVLPQGYFENLPAAVANKIELEEETKVYTALSAIGKENAFVIPEKYFEELAAEIKELVSPAKVIPIYSRALKSYKFAAAAAVFLVVTITVVLLNQRTEVLPSNECTTVACLSKKEIINSNYLQSASEESIIELIDVKALSDSLSLKEHGKKENVSVDEVSDNIDVNTLTEEL